MVQRSQNISLICHILTLWQSFYPNISDFKKRFTAVCELLFNWSRKYRLSVFFVNEERLTSWTQKLGYWLFWHVALFFQNSLCATAVLVDFVFGFMLHTRQCHFDYDGPRSSIPEFVFNFQLNPLFSYQVPIFVSEHYTKRSNDPILWAYNDNTNRISHFILLPNVFNLLYGSEVMSEYEQARGFTNTYNEFLGWILNETLCAEDAVQGKGELRTSWASLEPQKSLISLAFLLSSIFGGEMKSVKTVTNTGFAKLIHRARNSYCFCQ